MRCLRSLTVFFIGATIAAARPASADPVVLRDARVTGAAGDTTLRPAENPDRVITPQSGAPLNEGDIVHAGKRNGAEITMDGTVVFQLQAGARLKITGLSVQNTQLELTQGTVLAKVQPLIVPGQQISIILPTAVAAIRGTEFGATASNGQSHIGVFDEGHVAVTDRTGGQEIMLAPNQETQVSRSGKPLAPRALSHFAAYRTRMAPLRQRAAQWRKNWKPVSSAQRQNLRQHLIRRQVLRRTSGPSVRPRRARAANSGASRFFRQPTRRQNAPAAARRKQRTGQTTY